MYVLMSLLDLFGLISHMHVIYLCTLTQHPAFIHSGFSNPKYSTYSSENRITWNACWLVCLFAMWEGAALVSVLFVVR